MKNNARTPFAKAQTPAELAELIPGTKRPESQFDKFGKFLSTVANGEKIIAVKCYDNAIDVVTEPKE